MEISQSSWEATTASAHESPSPFLAITPPPRSRLGGLCISAIDYRRDAAAFVRIFIVVVAVPYCYMHSAFGMLGRRRSLGPTMPFITDFPNLAAEDGKRLVVLAAINQIGNGQTLRARRGGGPSCSLWRKEKDTHNATTATSELDAQ